MDDNMKWLQDALSAIHEKINTVSIQQNETKTIMGQLSSSMEALTREMDKLKESMGDHREEITLVKASVANFKERVEKEITLLKEEDDKQWKWWHERLGERKRECEIHHEDLDEAVAIARTEAVRDVKLWIYGIIAGLLVMIIMASIFIGRTLNDIDMLKNSRGGGSGYYREEKDFDRGGDDRRAVDRRDSDVLHAGGSGQN